MYEIKTTWLHLIRTENSSFATMRKSEIISRKDIVRLVAITLSNWYFLAIFPILFFLASFIYTHRIPEIYAAKCQILLKSNETYDYQEKIYRGLGQQSRYASYEETASQMRVIKSTDLIEKVLDRLSLNVSYFIVGRLKVTEIYSHMPFKVIADDRSSRFTGLPFSLKILDESRFELVYEVDGSEKTRIGQFGELILDDGLYIRVQKAKSLNQYSLKTLSKINYMFRMHRKPTLIQKYKSSIEVKNLDFTSIIEVSLNDQIPERAVEFLDTLANLYVQNTVENKKEINSNTLSYIQKQLQEVTRIINDIEAELELYKQEKEILNLSKEEETYYSRLVNLEADQREVELNIDALNDLTDYLLTNDQIESLLPPSIFVNDDDQNLKVQIANLYNLREEFLGLFQSGTDDNPRLKGLKEKIDKQKKDILYYVDIRVSALQNRLQVISNDIESYESRIMRIPRTQRQILNIERRLSVNEELYSFLLSKRAETIIAKAGLIPETKIIEKARGVGVVHPDKTKINLFNTLVGLGLAVGIILIRVLFFQKITTLGQLEGISNIPVLGSIPKQKSFDKKYRIRTGAERSQLSQAFRSLRTNLQWFKGSRDDVLITLVSSLLPGEGKTFTSVNLASVLAIAEKKVLIIDFDLHKPRLAKAMELPNDRGLSNYLVGDSVLEDVIQRTDNPFLSVITSGPVPPNASELVLSERVTSLCDTVSREFDYVFFDTPPISLITDGVQLARHADVKLFVLNSKVTSRTSVDYIEGLIEENDFRNCALIMNEEKVSKLGYYYARYGYGGYGGYGYGYGYGVNYGDFSDGKEG